MKNLLAIMLGICWVSAMGIKAHEEVQDEIGASIENNAAELKLLQQAASTCTEMYLIIADWEEDAEYIAHLTPTEAATMRRLVAAMRPCDTNMDVEIDPSVFIGVCFKGKNVIVTLDELDVVKKSEADPDGSYPLGRFVLTDEEYAQWRKLIDRVRQHKEKIENGAIR